MLGINTIYKEHSWVKKKKKNTTVLLTSDSCFAVLVKKNMYDTEPLNDADAY